MESLDTFKMSITILGAFWSLILILIAWSVSRLVKKLDSNTCKFEEVEKSQNKEAVKVAVINNRLCVLEEKFKSVDKMRDDINNIGSKIRRRERRRYDED